MGFKNKQARREYYLNNRDKINAQRRRHSSNPDVKKRIKENDKKWRENHKEELSLRNIAYSKKYKERIKEIVFDHYGRKCACCGEVNLIFLSIDHINGGGTIHRKKIRNHLNTWLVKNNLPSGFQTLCFNCNLGKHINGGICPHKQKKSLESPYLLNY